MSGIIEKIKNYATTKVLKLSSDALNPELDKKEKRP